MRQATPWRATTSRHLTANHIADVEEFLNDEARDYGIGIARPVSVELYPPVAERPPERAANSNVLQNMWWSLKLRMYARRAARASGKPPPQIRIFVLYHDPAFSQAVPHSVGLQKGLVGVVHAFADAQHDTDQQRGHRARDPAYARRIGQIRSGHAGAAVSHRLRGAGPDASLSADRSRKSWPAVTRSTRSTFEMPESLDEVVVGEATALEIRWIRK